MTKEELKSILYLDHLINSKLRQLDQLKAYRARLPAGSSDTGPVQSGPSDPTASAAIKIAMLDQAIMRDIATLVELKMEARRLFKKLDGDLQLKVVMEMRYLECMPWGKVAEHLHYGPRHVFAMHSRALDILFGGGSNGR